MSFEIYDLAGRRVHTAFAADLGIGPVDFSWEGRGGDGSLLLPGSYIWVLRVESDAFEEVHSGSIVIAHIDALWSTGKGWGFARAATLRPLLEPRLILMG